MVPSSSRSQLNFPPDEHLRRQCGSSSTGAAADRAAASSEQQHFSVLPFLLQRFGRGRTAPAATAGGSRGHSSATPPTTSSLRPRTPGSRCAATSRARGRPGRGPLLVRATAGEFRRLARIAARAACTPRGPRHVHLLFVSPVPFRVSPPIKLRTPSTRRGACWLCGRLFDLERSARLDYERPASACPPRLVSVGRRLFGREPARSRRARTLCLSDTSLVAAPPITVVGTVNLTWSRASSGCRGEDRHRRQLERVPGGKDANQAVAGARLGAT